MINPKLSLVPAENSPNFNAKFYRTLNCKKVHPIKILKHFYEIALFSCHIVSSYQGKNANKALFIEFDRRITIN